MTGKVKTVIETQLLSAIFCYPILIFADTLFTIREPIMRKYWVVFGDHKVYFMAWLNGDEWTFFESEWITLNL